MTTRLSGVALLLLSLQIALSTCFPVSPRDVVAVGPDGNLTLVDRWRDTVGTATQVWAHGAASEKDIFNTDRSGPISSVYRSTLSAFASTTCAPDGKRKCEVSIDGFGTVGEVHFVFDSKRANIKGRSTQVMVACRCLTQECGNAVLIRPINVLPKDGTNRRMCIYEAVKGKFSDCHTELLRVTYRDHGHRPNYSRGDGAFNYTVSDPNFGDFWNATGQRGWTRDCLDTDIRGLSVLNLSTLTPDDLNFNVHDTSPSSPHCTPKDSNVRYFREEAGLEDVEDECTALYDYAAAAAAHRATQQDEIATGNLESSYMFEKPELVSDTELALSCSAAGLGLLFVWSTFRKQKYKRNATLLYTLWVLTVQVLSYFLEALPLHTALGSEVSARNWVSLFAFVDGTLALAKSHPAVQGSADGSVIILTTVLGEVKYAGTRVMLVASLTVFFDITALIVIVLTILRKLRVNRLQKRGVLPKATSKDPEFSSQLPSMQFPEVLQPSTLLRATTRRSRGRHNGRKNKLEDSMDDEVSETTTAGNERSPGTSGMTGLPSTHSMTWESEVLDDSIDGGCSEVQRAGGATTRSCIHEDSGRVEKPSGGVVVDQHVSDRLREVPANETSVTGDEAPACMQDVDADDGESGAVRNESAMVNDDRDGVRCDGVGDGSESLIEGKRAG